VVSTFHDLFVMTGTYSSPAFRKRFTGQAVRAAAQSDLIIAVSEFTAKQVETLLGFERSRIRVIPHGVRTRPALSTAAREKLILFVGALQKRKNVSRLVDAMELLPSDWNLVLVGSPTGFQSTEILDRIRHCRSRERIEVAGYVTADALETLYERASIFAFPSLDEGFGMPVLEAMARGVPVVTSNRSALAEVAGTAAMLVDPEDTEEIASALLSLIEEESMRSDFAVKGLARAAGFTWEKAVNDTWAVYAELMAH
jgi:glycosyltransferase involved in cell wall biosynthesis